MSEAMKPATGRVQCFDYDIGDRVIVKEIGRPGKVDALLIDYAGVQYKVLYWDNSKREVQWLQADELERRQ